MTNKQPLKIFILGVNGFIGSTLSDRILKTTDWEIHGIDLDSHKLGDLRSHERMHFTQGDISQYKNWIEQQIEQCDVVLPLVAVATPSLYVKNPLYVFELDFEANLEIIRLCSKYNKHVIFPSTSEVYGMSEDTPFDEQSSRLVLGPINKPRWIYSCSKQLMDRVIHAYGMQKDLNYTLFRPFNWIGAKLDNMINPKEGAARVLSQFVGNILNGRDIQLVDGGHQRRCFTYIEDGIDGLMRIIEHRHDSANRQIFNLGNPANDYSIKQLADMTIAQMKQYPKYEQLAERTQIIEVSSGQYYGEGYQDVSSRIPKIDQAKKLLDWQPSYDMPSALKLTLDAHFA